MGQQVLSHGIPFGGSRHLGAQACLQLRFCWMPRPPALPSQDSLTRPLLRPLQLIHLGALRASLRDVSHCLPMIPGDPLVMPPCWLWSPLPQQQHRAKLPPRPPGRRYWRTPGTCCRPTRCLCLCQRPLQLLAPPPPPLLPPPASLPQLLPLLRALLLLPPLAALLPPWLMTSGAPLQLPPPALPQLALLLPAWLRQGQLP